MTTPTTGPTTGPNPSNPPLVIGTQVIPNWVPGTVSTPISATPRETLDLAGNTFEKQLVVSGMNEPIPVTYGIDRIGWKFLTALGYGTSLLMVGVWGRGPIQAINSLTVNNTTPPGTVLATHYLGTSTQTVDSKLVAAFAAIGITHTDALLGLAYTVLEFPPGTDIGDVHAVISGRKIYDQRDGTQTLGTPSTYKWTDVPACALSDLIADSTYGWGKQVVWSTQASTGNANDAVVSGEKKRIIGITLDTRQSAEEWVDILRAHAGCYVVPSPSGYKLVPDATASSVRTFAKADIVKGSLQWAMKPTEQQPNVIEISYTDTSAYPWTTRKAVYPANGIPPGSEELRLSRRNMPGVQRYSQALREAIEMFNHSRLEALQHRFTTFADALAQEPGDVITINDGGLTAGITFRMLSRTMSKKGLFEIAAQKYDPAAFDSSAAAAPSTGNTTLPSASNPPTVTGLALTENVEAPGPGGTPSSSIIATVTAVTWPFLSKYVWYAYDQAGNLIDEAETVGPSWRSIAFSAPRVVTVYCKARSTLAIASGYASASITLSGNTSSLTLLTSTRVFSAGASFSNYDSSTLYPGDPYLRCAPNNGAFDVSFGSQFASSPISAATVSVLTFNRQIDNPERATHYAKTAAIDLGASKPFTAALTGAPTAATLYDSLYPAVGFEAADSLSGPWDFALGTVVTLTGRYVRMVAFPRNIANPTFPDGGSTVSVPPYSTSVQNQDFGAATISIYGQTVEETDTVTTSASGPVTVTLAIKYAALRDLQVTAVQSGGTAVVTADAISLSPTLANTFQINATVSGTRVAVPVRWNFKGAL